MSSADVPPGIDPRSTPAADEPAGDIGLDEGGGALRPAVAGRSSGAAPWLVGGGAVVLGLATFLWLSSHRPHAATNDLPPPSQAADAAMVAAPPPPPEVNAMEAAGRGVQPPRPPPAVAVVTPPPPVPLISSAPPLPATPPPSPAGKAPVLVVDLAGATDAGATAAAKPVAAAGSAAGSTRLNADEQFAARVETGPEPEHASATLLHNQSTLAPQGTIIPAVLETALNSDLPGFARAVVSRDVRSFDGANVLIPRGSRVIGEYRSAVALGQSRIFVIWTRVLRPDGGSIQIGSGGGDTLGRAGLAGKVDRHFFERFSGAVLLTVLNAAAYAAAGTPSTQVTIGSTAGSGGATSGLLPTDIPPTIKVAQGTPIRIFVQRDLDFTPVDGR
ncbi:TrbI/VirB10 family protein [Caulobacter sp. S45]|uniref:TrbI/VirB10 family protein n=1 Tax=Caulobacter sp. S45 TaxID=1641861 RepID=UPI0015765A93|nr:TrbI/VirB10 family protein [Caulobacter sp. S45]